MLIAGLLYEQVALSRQLFVMLIVGLQPQQIAISSQLFQDGITLYNGLVNYRVTMVAQAPGGTPSVAFMELLANTPPSGGTCSVSPLTGTSSTTQFTIICSGWTHPLGIQQYQFMSK